MSRRQGIFWLLTIPENDWHPKFEESCTWLKGQLEEGKESGYRHWQFVVSFKRKSSLAAVKKVFGNTAHCELTRSESANDYCSKEETRVEGTEFEYGSKPIRRNSKTDWDAVWTAAKSGNVDAIPAHVRITSYR